MNLANWLRTLSVCIVVYVGVMTWQAWTLIRLLREQIATVAAVRDENERLKERDRNFDKELDDRTQSLSIANKIMHYRYMELHEETKKGFDVGDSKFWNIPPGLLEARWKMPTHRPATPWEVNEFFKKKNTWGDPEDK